MSSPPNLVAFLKELKARVDKEVPNEGGRSRASLPILAISETPDSFLIDSIVDANAEFSKLWPAKREFDEPALVEAFVALVTAAKTHDARLQKLCDKLVPKKTDELTFWRRYFAHVHALLIRLSPTDAESLREMARRLPPPRPLAARRFAPAADLRTSGSISRAELLALFADLSGMVVASETISALGEEAAAAVAAGDHANLEIACTKLCLSYQLEYIEHKGFEREFGLLSMQPPALAKAYPDAEGADQPVHGAFHKFQQACMQAVPQAVQRQQQRPSDDPAARRFRPAAGGPTVTSASQLDTPAALLPLVTGITTFLDGEETAAQLRALAADQLASLKEGGMSAQAAMHRTQQELLHTMARWQREYLESVGVSHEAGIKAIWSIGDSFQPVAKSASASKDKAGDGGAKAEGDGVNDLLQAFGSLRLTLQGAMQAAVLEASKPAQRPATERRFAPKGPPESLQSSGLLSRDFLIAFTTKAAAVLTSDESIGLLGACGSMEELSTLSVQWQRELLEHMGVQMDFGCHALGATPQRFGDDQEVMRAFGGFVEACQTSGQKAMEQIRTRAIKAGAADPSAPPELK